MQPQKHTGDQVNVFYQFMPKSVENRSALRTSAAVLIAILIAFTLHLSTPYWAGITVLIVSNIYIGSILDKALLRVVGTLVGAWFGYFVAAFAVNSFAIFLLVCFLIAAISTYYYQISRYAYAFLLAGISAFLVLSQLGISTGNAFSVAIWRSAEICLGVIVAALSAFCLFPNNLKDAFDKQIDMILTKASLEVESLQQFLCLGTASLEDIATMNLELKKELKNTLDMVSSMRFEVSIPSSQIETLRALLELMQALMRKLNYFVASLTNESLAGLLPVKYPIDAVFNAIQNDLTMLKNVYSGQCKTDLHLQVKPAIEVLDKLMLDNTESSRRDDRLYYHIRHLVQQLSDILGSLGILLIGQQRLLLPKDVIYSRAKRLQNDPDVIKQSIKVGLTLVLAMLIWLVSSWPGGINGIISSTVISIRTNIFEMKGVSLQRALGCLLGGGISLVILFFVSLNVYDLMVVLFFLIWGFSYFSFKYPRHSYIGLQANIALVITMAQEGGPPIYLEPPLERLGGIGIGIIASFIVANALWRYDALTALARRQKKISRFLCDNIREVVTKNKENIILHDITGLFWASRGIIDSQTNERLSNKKQKILIDLKQSFERSVLIQASVRYIYDSINRANAHVTAETLGMDIGYYESSVDELYHHGSKELNQLIGKLDEYLSWGEKKQTLLNVTQEQLTNFLAYVHALRQLALNARLISN